MRTKRWQDERLWGKGKLSDSHVAQFPLAEISLHLPESRIPLRHVPTRRLTSVEKKALAMRATSGSSPSLMHMDSNTHQRGEEGLGHACHLRVLPVPHAHGDAGDVPLDLHHVVEDEVAQHAQAATTDS